jgi:hypothetical protein
VGLAIFGVRLGQPCVQLTHAWVKFSWVAQRRFFNSAICVSWSELSPPLGGAESGSDCSWVGLFVGWIVTANVFTNFQGVELSSLGVVGQSDPCGVVLSQYVNLCGVNPYSVRWCGSECHSV